MLKLNSITQMLTTGWNRNNHFITFITLICVPQAKTHVGIANHNIRDAFKCQDWLLLHEKKHLLAIISEMGPLFSCNKCFNIFALK